MEGSTEKVLQLIIELKSIYNKNLDFVKQKCIFEHYREVQTRKSLLIYIIFCRDINYFPMTFSELPSISLC
jgi:hypothetical protein